MAKKKGAQPETKSDFLRKVLSKNPELDYQQVNRRWAKSGRAGEISNALYYQIRAKLGIKTEWAWVKVDDAKPPKSSPSASPGQVYQFKITLKETRPPIWRRIQVGDCTLDELHEHIQTAMGWTNSHLHLFRVDGTLYADPLLMEEDFEELECKNSTTTKLSQILPASGARFQFEYEYDFGDGWAHDVLFEGCLPAEKGKRYPLCLEGARACPPEDVGGVWGYQDFLAALADLEHERHGELRDWIDRKFDPDAFDPTDATRSMKRGLPE